MMRRRLRVLDTTEGMNGPRAHPGELRGLQERRHDGQDGAFVLRVDGECASTVLTATVDGQVNSSSVSVCVEEMVGVQVTARFYPGGQAVSDVVPKIPCTSEHHRVQATAACSTTVGTRSAVPSAVNWQIGEPVSSSPAQQSSVVVSMLSAADKSRLQIAPQSSQLRVHRPSFILPRPLCGTPSPNSSPLWRGQ